MRGRAGAGAAVVGAVLAASACATSQVTPIGPPQPPHLPGCPIQTFPNAAPYPIIEVASVVVTCPSLQNQRHLCTSELHRAACAAGADTAVGLHEGYAGEDLRLIATLAVRSTAAAPGAASTERPTPGMPDDCDPICSPGFVCRGRQCLPLCNPPCEVGEVCTRRRICEAPPPKL